MASDRTRILRRRWYSRVRSLFVEIANQPISQVAEAIDFTQLVSEYLLDAGERSMNVDGSTTPVDYIYMAPPGKTLILNNLNIYIEANTAFDTDEFANLPALVNGVLPMVNGVAIRTWNTTLEMILDSLRTAPIGDIFTKQGRSAAIVFSMSEITGGRPLRVTSSVCMRIQDNLGIPSLVFQAKVQGYLVNG